MKKTIVLLCSMVTGVIVVNTVLLCLIMVVIMEPTGEPEAEIIYHDHYGGTDNYVEPKMAIADKEMALAIGSAMLEECYGIADAKYKVRETTEPIYYWEIIGYNEIETYTDEHYGERVILYNYCYIYIHKKDSRVLYTDRMETRNRTETREMPLSTFNEQFYPYTNP